MSLVLIIIIIFIKFLVYLNFFEIINIHIYNNQLIYLLESLIISW